MASPESAADRAVFFSDWSDAVTYVLAAGGGSTEVVGRLDEHASLAGGGPGAYSTALAFQMAEADLPAGAAGGENADRLETPITSLSPDPERVFAVMEIKRDGTGMVTLILEEIEA